jgi:hypothetical protein
MEPLARIGGHTFICTSGQHLINGMLAQHEQPAVLSAVMKYETTNRSRLVINDGMDILGGAGICRGPSNVLGNTYMNVPIGVTVEGANILTRTMITFGQGLTRAHPHLYDVIKSLESKDDVRGFAKHTNAMIGHALANVARSMGSGLRSFVPGSGVSHYEAQLQRLSANFAVCSDLCLTLGGRLKFEEMTSGRMADVLGKIYLGYACLWYYQRVGGGAVEGLDILLQYSMDLLLSEAQEVRSR